MAVNEAWVAMQLRRHRDFVHAVGARVQLDLPERRELEDIRASLGPAPQDERAMLLAARDRFYADNPTRR